MHKCLDNWDISTIRWPTKSQQRSWAVLLTEYEPLIKNKWGFVDGKNFRVQRPTNSELQNAYYNGWLHCEFVTGVLLFGIEGCIVWGKHNNPGSWNDSIMSVSMFDKLLDPEKSIMTHGILADSAFPVSGLLSDRIVTPLKANSLRKVPLQHHAAIRRQSNAITRCRQAAEWGMGAVSKVFRRLRLPLCYNPDRRRILLSNCFRLYNFRVRTTGISQIRSVFYSPHLAGESVNEQ